MKDSLKIINECIENFEAIEGISLEELQTIKKDLGCPLEVIFKALKQGYIYVDMEIFEFPQRKIKNVQKKKVNIIHFGGQYFHIGYTYDYEVALCDYGKTWWLKKDMSE